METNRHRPKPGDEGLTSFKNARKMLGGVSRNTVKARASEGKIVLFRDPDTGSLSVCTRSIREYIESMQVTPTPVEE